MKVLSLFDGISCAQVALNKAGIDYDEYHASEIDKYAITITQKNYPNTKQLGNITCVKGGDYNLIVGGSPCQGFSFAGKRLNFDDPRSKLFFEYVRILRDNKECYFLLENVRMKQECQDVINDLLGVKPIIINSALVSGQNRTRLYWTNIEGIEQPSDKGIHLVDVLESGAVDKDKSACLTATYYKGTNLKRYCTVGGRQIVYTNNGKNTDLSKPIKIGHYGKGSQGQKIYDPKSKSVTLKANGGGMGGASGLYQITAKEIRKLTPLECERLQTLPDNYTEGVSNTQRYKALGNGFTVDVIAHIFENLKLK